MSKPLGPYPPSVRAGDWIIVSGHFFKLVINFTRLEDASGRTVGRLVCSYDVEREMRLVVIWLLVVVGMGGHPELVYPNADLQQEVAEKSGDNNKTNSKNTYRYKIKKNRLEHC